MGHHPNTFIEFHQCHYVGGDKICRYAPAHHCKTHHHSPTPGLRPIQPVSGAVTAGDTWIKLTALAIETLLDQQAPGVYALGVSLVYLIGATHQKLPPVPATQNQRRVT